MPTGDDDDGSVWATTLPPHYVDLSAVARANAAVVAALITAPRKTHTSIKETDKQLAKLEEPVLTTLAKHPLPGLIEELGLSVTNPDLVATLALGEIDRRRRREETTKWTWDRIGRWAVAVIVALIALIGVLIGVFFK